MLFVLVIDAPHHVSSRPLPKRSIRGTVMVEWQTALDTNLDESDGFPAPPLKRMSPLIQILVHVSKIAHSECWLHSPRGDDGSLVFHDCPELESIGRFAAENGHGGDQREYQT